MQGDLRKGNCPLCRHHEILEAHAGAVHIDRNEATLLPLQVTQPEGRGLIDSFLRAYRGEAERPPGELRTYACRKCGYAQMFVMGCGDVPIDPEKGTRLIVGAASDDPYR